ncbi:HAMP domain-containing sensor histidine kinase [Bradyrhizobium sp. CIAT3101]|uniref:sensor histidine kinase n=1 Tax=Bradyrhizobium sp. CIAT3101 TaxID=439387 RepID=UPI0024B0E8FF|nr:HAMP domain-containing sensor histidine kinase [Bradyrhizobium sp. CIAT3101]WFU85033.1 HAMP domain-containing sensor histidine kinase [Bradyrhizobium sp. CIAT3101]
MSRHDDPYCLRSRLSWRLLALQAALLLALVTVVVGALCASGFVLAERDEDRVIDVVQRALAHNADGDLILRSTPDLKQLRAETSDLWFLVRDRQGHSLTEGAVPPEFAAIGGGLDQISQARLGWQMFEDDPRKPAARLKRVETDAGNVQIITATQGRLTGAKALLMTSLAFLGIALPGLLVMGTATFIATPMIVQRAFRGLDTTADQARRIDIHQRGARLSVERIPLEVVPLVTAVNDALARLDQGYARHKRFVADAAHELRTPIAILNTRLESLPSGPDKTRLLEDAARLATLAEQLLDIQRLDRCGHPFTRIDLVAMAQSAAADLAPLAIAAGYELALDAPSSPIETIGDAAALERALTNLVQNAIQHGPRRGTIGIRVSKPACIEVTDEGAGIPRDQREQIFEPFYRLSPLDRGAGLGLNMVREIVLLHGGQISVTDGIDGGTCFRMTLRPGPQI